jgi:hypothetical protein
MWIKFESGTVPDGYEIRLFVHCGLMIRKIDTEELLRCNLDELTKKLKKYDNK